MKYRVGIERNGKRDWFAVPIEGKPAALKMAYQLSLNYGNASAVIRPEKTGAKITLYSNAELRAALSPAKKPRKKNPVPEGKISKLKKANALYESFRDQKGADMLEYDMPDFSAGMVVGRCTGILYDTVRAGKRENYVHKFTRHAAPLLCVTADGKHFFSMDGNFDFTERGFLDRKS